MASTYTAPLPPGTTDPRDAELRGTNAGMPIADIAGTDAANANLVLTYLDDRVIPPATLAAWRAAVANPTPPANAPWRARQTLETQVDLAMAAMQQIIDTADIPAGTLTTAQLSTHVRSLQTAVKAEARLLRRIVRVMRSDYTGTD